MSIMPTSVLDRDNLNRAFVSKSATGTQIMAGSLRLLGGITVDGTFTAGNTTLGTLTAGVTTLGALTITGALSAGAQTITTTGRVNAGTFAGNGAAITALNGTNISAGTVADARLSTNVVLLNTAQTFTANNTYSATANLFFAGGTTYKIDTTGSAYFNALQVAGNVTLDGNDYLTFGSAGLSVPGNSSTGTKIKLYGDSYQIGVNTSTVWYDSNANHQFYSNGGTVTRVLNADITPTALNAYNDLNVSKNLDVYGELKAGVNNEFPDPLVASKTANEWATINGSSVFDAAQSPPGTGAIGSIKTTATAADNYSIYSYDFDVSPSEWITFSSYAFATAASKTAELHIQWRTSAKAIISNSSVSFTAALSWTRQQLTAQAPATARYFRVRIDNDTSGAIMYWSAFQVERGRALTGFKPYQGGKELSISHNGSTSLIYSDYKTQLSSNFYVTGNVGIGVPNPTQALDVSGSIKLTSNIQSPNTVGFLNVGAAQKINVGGLLVSNTFADESKVPTSGAYIKGDISAAGNLVFSNGASLIDFATSRIRDNGTGSLIISASGTGKTIYLRPNGDTADANALVLSPTSMTYNGSTVWHAGNDGAGSGLDADLLDGLNSTSFMRTDVNTSTTGSITLGTGTASVITGQADGTITVSNISGNIEIGPKNASYAHIYTDRPTFYFNKELLVNGSKVWHLGNDGTGSGLDADLLDGVHLAALVQTTRTIASGTGITGGGDLSANRTLAFDTTWGDARYLGLNSKATDSDKLAGLTAVNYLRSNTNSTFTGTLTLNGKLDISGDIESDKPIYLTAIPGTHRESGKMNSFSRLSGRITNRNSDFINQTMTGYVTYGAAETGSRIVRTLVTDTVTPNASGYIMRISYDPARSTTATTSGFGGFAINIPRDATNDLSGWEYRAGNRYIVRVVAYIPAGRTLNYDAGSYGTGGGTKWLSSQEGTTNWQEYVIMHTMGTTGTFGTIGSFYISGGTDAVFTWDVAICQVIGIDEVSDVDRAPTMNVGYKPGVDIGWGEVYASGKITSDVDFETKGGSFLTKNSSALGLQNASKTSYIYPQHTDGNTWIKNGTAAKAIYLDSAETYIRSHTGANQLTIASTGAATFHNNITVNGSATVLKGSHIISGGSATEWFKIEALNRLYLNYDNPTKPVDIGKLGSTLLLNVYGNITGSGTASFGATTVGSLTSSGVITVDGSGRINIPTVAGQKDALQIGGVTIGQTGANGSMLIMTNLSEFRFGSATNATWDNNKWGGIKYITTTDTMIIGGPASANFAANASPPRIYMNFEGIREANFDGKVIVKDTVNGTIDGTTMANGWIQIGPVTNGLALDTNEVVSAGSELYLGTIGAFDTIIRSGISEKARITSTGRLGVGIAAPTENLHVVGTGRVTGNTIIGGTLAVTGALTGSTITSSGITTAGGFALSAGVINHNALDSYDKIRVWNAANYVIGMKSAQTFGYLNDYAMTFTMSPEVNRGFLWRDSSDVASDGAMSLTTDGRLHLKDIANVGSLNVRGAATFGAAVTFTNGANFGTSLVRMDSLQVGSSGQFKATTTGAVTASSISAPNIGLADKVEFVWNAANNSLDFVFI